MLINYSKIEAKNSCINSSASKLAELMNCENYLYKPNLHTTVHTLHNRHTEFERSRDQNKVSTLAYFGSGRATLNKNKKTHTNKNNLASQIAVNTKSIQVFSNLRSEWGLTF